jgi:hypothetical protein
VGLITAAAFSCFDDRPLAMEFVAMVQERLMQEFYYI